MNKLTKAQKEILLTLENGDEVLNAKSSRRSWSLSQISTVSAAGSAEL